MNTVIEDVLVGEVLTEIQEMLPVHDHWEKSVAEERQMGGYKKNSEMTFESSPNCMKVLSTVGQILVAHQSVKSSVLADCIFPPKFNKYAIGDYYAPHCDDLYSLDAQNRRMRRDVAFTLFLSSPDSYEGGELVISDGMFDPTPYKLPPGHIVLYPSTHLHWVNEVTKGVSYVIIGWIQSFVPEAYLRNQLLCLHRILWKLSNGTPHRDIYPLVEAHRNTLMSMWGRS